jgi:membrane-anchored protein YejM (alkaline phosphatase superfamily)
MKTSIKKITFFVLMNTLIAIVISLRYLKNLNTDYDVINGLYLILTSSAHYFLLCLFGIGMIPLILWLLFKSNKILNGSLIILSTILLSILVIDTYIFDFFRFHINGLVLGIVFGGAFRENFPFSTTIYVLSTIGFILLFLSQFGLLKLAKNLANRVKIKTTYLILLSSIIIYLFANLTYAWADAVRYSPITKTTKFYPLYFPLTAKSFFRKFIDIEEAAEKYKIVNKSDLVYPKKEIVFNKKTEKPNIIILAIDSWNYQYMDSIMTPNIYKFSKESYVFSNHSSGSNGTRGSLFSIFYSLPSFYWEDMSNNSTSPILLESLKKHDYNINTFVSSPIYEFKRTIFCNTEVEQKTEGKTVPDREIKITENFINFIDSPKSKERFFSFIFYDALHAYLHPKNFKKKFKPAWDDPKYYLLNNDMDPTEFINLYKNAALFVDGLVGKIINKLEKTGLINNTILIVTGDHGQEFNENKKNYWGHNGNYTKYQINIPTFIKIPNKEPKQFNHWTSHYDIAPFIMENVLGSTNDIFDYSIGKNMLDTNERDWLVSGSKIHFGVVEKDRITTMDYDGSYEITDHHLNPIPNAKMRSKKTTMILNKINSFYKN